MRKYARDFRMFTGGNVLISTLSGMLISMLLFAGLAAVRSYAESEMVKGFCEGFMPMFCLVIPIIGYIPCNVIFSLNRPTTPGYKFFHSLPEASVHFRRAIVAGSLASLIMLLIWAGVLWIWSPAVALLILFIGLILKGVQNFFGHAKSTGAMFVPSMAVIFAMGIFIGFIGEDVDLFSADVLDVLPFTAAGAAVFVIGTIYCAAIAEKKWHRED